MNDSDLPIGLSLSSRHASERKHELFEASSARNGFKSFFHWSAFHPSPITPVAAEVMSGLLLPKVPTPRRRYASVTKVAFGKRIQGYELRAAKC